MLKVVQENTESNVDATVHGGSLLDEIVRDGARQMLAAALQAEVAAYVERFAGEVDEHGHRLVVRNGYHAAREVTTAPELDLCSGFRGFGHVSRLVSRIWASGSGH